MQPSQVSPEKVVASLQNQIGGMAREIALRDALIEELQEALVAKNKGDDGKGSPEEGAQEG